MCPVTATGAAGGEGRDHLLGHDKVLYYLLVGSSATSSAECTRREDHLGPSGVKEPGCQAQGRAEPGAVPPGKWTEHSNALLLLREEGMKCMQSRLHECELEKCMELHKKAVVG